MKLKSNYRVPPHKKVKLSDIPTKESGHYTSAEDALPDTTRQTAELDDLQEVFAAAASHSLLVVLQAMDSGGKDGTIRHIFSGVNPQGCDVTQFKVPTPLEQSHDFLWRVHNAVPAKGKIGIFNRSHYEDVLVTRVHGMIDAKETKRRYEEIVNFERSLTENGVIILKFFLHISHQEQTARLKARLDMPDKQWKISPSDLKERKFWPEYQKAYEDAISATSRKFAPWFIVPSDHKWYRNVVVSRIIVETMAALKLKYPRASFDISKIKI
jgi:PPK2 family polyphosphate:nucleotide phosphotransferase